MWHGDTPVSGNTDHIEVFQAVDYSICNKRVIYPDIVMDEQEQVVIGFRVNACVVYSWKAKMVRECNLSHQSIVESEPVD
jgi:hypothetical protein